MSHPVITASQILSETAVPPEADLHRVTDVSASARANQMFPSFKSDTLTPFESQVLDSFRAYIYGMSRVVDFTGNVIGYPAPRSLPGKHGHAMRNEADVRTFANSLYIDPAKAVMLEMLPDAPDRAYDWVIQSEAMPPPSLAVEIQSIPDMALAKRMRYASSLHDQVERDLPVVLIEFKSPSVVFLARNSAQSYRDESPDWKAMTKQLRKYAVLWNCRRLVLMDERLACFFYLPAADLMDPNQEIHFLSAEAPSTVDSPSLTASPLGPQVTGGGGGPTYPSLATRIEISIAGTRSSFSIPSGTRRLFDYLEEFDPGPSQGFSHGAKTLSRNVHTTRTDSESSAPLTIRELLAFAAWHALGDEPGVNQRKNYEQVGMEVQPCGYTPLILPDGGTNPGGKPNKDKGKRKAPSSRTRKQTVFFPAVEHTHMVLTRCESIDMTPNDYRFDDTSVYHSKYSAIHLDPCLRCSEPDAESGYHSDTDPHKSTSASATCRHDAKDTLRLNISRENLLSGLSILDLHRVSMITDRVSTGHLVTSPHASFPDITIILKRFAKRSYLFRELLAYAQLHHLQGAEIPGCYGVFTNAYDKDDADLYLALEHINCDTIATGMWCSSAVEALLPEARATLDAVHRAGVCHGDISARNVLVDPEDERGVILVDWDLSVVGCGADTLKSEDCAALEWVFGHGLRV